MAERIYKPQFVQEHYSQLAQFAEMNEDMGWFLDLPETSIDGLTIDHREWSNPNIDISLELTPEQRAKYMGEGHPLEEVLMAIGVGPREGFKLILSVSSGAWMSAEARYSTLDERARLEIGTHDNRPALIRSYAYVKGFDPVAKALAEMDKLHPSRIRILENTRFFVRRVVIDMLDMDRSPVTTPGE